MKAGEEQTKNQRAEGRGGQNPEGRGQRAEGSGQRAKGSADIAGQTALFCITELSPVAAKSRVPISMPS